MMRISILIYLTAFVSIANAQNHSTMTINQEAPVFQTKSIVISEKPEKIWEILTDVESWTKWNNKIKKTQIDEELKIESEFIWTSGGAKITSKVYIFDSYKTLGWTGKTFGARAIHNWHFEKVEGGTKITVEESMEGWLISLMKKKMNIILEEDMMFWLEQLKIESEK
jgi:uncharacterized protein YndB with AHSA1/START domain